ncbi:competence protein ComFA [Halolactibacillus halophilus]|uniref:Competence protein ComFA n=1 Tax=Halolactibacillus halophilus TaxID=306540 RepID=A0A1I5QBP2_9BACI|nr:helicase-related protein [Halolactibacillus halophilus]GEM01725.1 DNA/RNA helicase [Halolactibacillus halophilus]SFP43517.1 competence protein ComFA [Halolactibacillus halophilus]
MLKQLDQSIRMVNHYINQQWLTVKKSVITSSKRIQSLTKQGPTLVKESNAKKSLIAKQTDKVKTTLKQLEAIEDTYLLLDGLLVTHEQLGILKKQRPDLNQVIDIRALPAITKTRGFMQCARCLNTDRALFLPFPCGKCHKTDWYCLNCLKYGRLASCQTLFHLTIQHHQTKPLQTGFQFTSTLTPHQERASDQLVNAIQTNERHLLIHAVCGAGKTEMLFRGINQALLTGKRVCVATPRQDVIKELLPRFQAVFTDVPIICQYGGSDDNHKRAWLTLCTTHQLIRYKLAFDVLIIDEVDAFPYHNDQHLIKQAARALKDTGTFIYLSATPRPALVKKRYPTCFVPVRYHGHPLPVPRPYFTSFKHTPLPKNVREAITNERENNRQLLIFVATIKQAEALLPHVQAAYPTLTIEAVHARSEKRKALIDEFRLRTIDILITTTILERGVTFPSVDVFVLQADHDVFDEAALVQIAGRAGRSKDDPTGSVQFYFETYTKAIRKSIKSINKMNVLGERL